MLLPQLAALPKLLRQLRSSQAERWWQVILSPIPLPISLNRRKSLLQYAIHGFSAQFYAYWRKVLTHVTDITQCLISATIQLIAAPYSIYRIQNANGIFSEFSRIVSNRYSHEPNINVHTDKTIGMTQNLFVLITRLKHDISVPGYLRHIAPTTSPTRFDLAEHHEMMTLRDSRNLIPNALNDSSGYCICLAGSTHTNICGSDWVVTF